MPGHIATVYVATDANSLITPVTAGWVGGHMATAAPVVCLCPAGLTSGDIYGTLRPGCLDVDYSAVMRFPCREKRCFAFRWHVVGQLAQLVRALRSHRRGHRFESCAAH